MLRALTMLACLGTLVGCSPGNPAASPSAVAPARAATNALAGTPMAAYGHDLEKAKNVQDVVDKQAKGQAAAIDSVDGSH